MDAKSYAFYLLSKRDYFENQLRKKLEQKGFDTEEINEVINYLKENNYIDDNALLGRYKELAIQKGTSQLKLKQKLYKKGIKDIEFTYEELLLSAQNLMKKYKKEREFKSIIKFLMNRGFPYDIASEVATKYINGEI